MDTATTTGGVAAAAARRAETLLPAAALAAVLVGLLHRVVTFWLTPYPPAPAYTAWVVDTTVAGTAYAPNQYRPLMPWVEHLASSATGLPTTTTILLADAALAAALVALAYRLAAAHGQPAALFAAAGLVATWSMQLMHWHPEVMLLAVATTAAVLVLDRHPDRRWAPWALLGLAALMCGTRTDYAATLGIVVVAVGVRRRDARLAVAGVASAVLAAAATVVLVKAYPQAAYITDLVQLRFNLTTGYSWAVIAACYAPLALLASVTWRHARTLPLWPVWVWFAAQFAATFVVGRVAETRIFWPFAPVLGVAAFLAWRSTQQRPA